MLVSAFLGPVGSAIGGIFHSIAGAVLGAFTWTIGLATRFILITIGALVHLLIPHSWLHKGVQIMQWIVAVPDYAGRVSSPGGGTQYGFAGINSLRELCTWLGLATVPLTLTYATSRATLGDTEPVGIPVLRVLATGTLLLSYGFWWSQIAALVNQITNTILTLPAVSAGLEKLMEYAVDGVALGGWQLIDLGLMGATGLALLALIFVKVAVILLGALLFAVGPLMLGLVPTRTGGALARAWLSAVITLFALGVGWALLFAVGALLIGDAGTAGPLIAGNSAMGSLAGGLLLACAGLAALWLSLKAAREMAGLLRAQLGGLLAIGRGGGVGGGAIPAGATGSARGRTTGGSMRAFGARLAGAAGAADGELSQAVSGTPLGTAGRAVGHVGRRGLIGTAAVASAGAVSARGPQLAELAGRSRAGAVAVRMARAGTASWRVTGAAASLGGRSRAGSPGGRGAHTIPPPAGSRRTDTPEPRAARSTKAPEPRSARRTDAPEPSGAGGSRAAAPPLAAPARTRNPFRRPSAARPEPPTPDTAPTDAQPSDRSAPGRDGASPSGAKSGRGGWRRTLGATTSPPSASPTGKHAPGSATSERPSTRGTGGKGGTGGQRPRPAAPPADRRAPGSSPRPGGPPAPTPDKASSASVSPRASSSPPPPRSAAPAPRPLAEPPAQRSQQPTGTPKPKNPTPARVPPSRPALSQPPAERPPSLRTPPPVKRSRSPRTPPPAPPRDQGPGGEL